jgi:hypothetical protein
VQSMQFFASWGRTLLDVPAEKKSYQKIHPSEN